MADRKKLGEIFVEHGIISAKTSERILARSKVINKRFGQVLEDLELITGDELASALAFQYNCKIVKNLVTLPFHPELKEIITLEVAMQNLLFPLKKEKEWLALAMADPTNTAFVGNLAANRGLKIAPYVASKEEILAAICQHYMGRCPVKSDKNTVLIIDDDMMMLNIFNDALKEKGYRVIKALDGFEGYKTAVAEKPNVIVTDKEMPRMDGYTLLSALRNSTETNYIPVILVTGNMSPEEEAKAFDKGFFDFISKPVKSITLQARVQRALRFHEYHYRLY